MAKRGSLREFQENLVKRLAEANVGNRRGLLGIEAGNERWLVDLPSAGEILPPPPLTTVPLSRPWFRGLTNVRGTLFSVVDFSAFQGGTPIIPGGQTRLLLVGERFGTNVALLINRATGLRSPEDFEPDDQPPPAERPWIDRSLRDVQNRLWYHLDMPRLMATPAFLDAGTD